MWEMAIAARSGLGRVFGTRIAARSAFQAELGTAREGRSGSLTMRGERTKGRLRYAHGESGWFRISGADRVAE